MLRHLIDLASKPVGFIALLGGALVTMQASADPDTPPAVPVVASPAALDFGSVPCHGQASRVVRLVNRLDLPVGLLEPDSDCTCVTGTLSERLILPGQSITWTVRLSACDYVGDVRKRTWVSLGGAQTRVDIPVRYEVVPDLFVEPEVVNLGLLGDTPVETEVCVRTLTDRSIMILAEEAADPAVEVEVSDPLVTRDKPGRISVYIRPPFTGDFRSSITLRTTASDLRIPLVGEGGTGLHSDRREMYFDAVPLGSSQVQKLVIAYGPTLQFGNVHTSNDAVDVTAVERSAVQVVLTIKTNERAPLGTFKGFLLFEINNGRPRQVKYSYRGRVVETDRACASHALPGQTLEPGSAPGRAHKFGALNDPSSSVPCSADCR